MQSVSYMGDGTTTEFTFNFPYYENSNIIVTKNGTTATGYNIIGTSGGLDADIPYTGGKVVFETAPSSLDSITIARHLPLTRTVDYQPTAKIEPTTLNQDMNYLMELLKDQSTDLINLHTQYTEIADKDSTATLLARITEIGNKITAVNQTITDFNTAIADGRIMSRDDFYKYTTNCLTEMPQDIKLELSSGTLILKEGSKAYRPNGAGVFTQLTNAADRTLTHTTNGTYMVFSFSFNSITLFPVGSVFSGATVPSVSGSAVWYDTTNNVIKATYDSGSTWDGTILLPLGVVTVSSGAISSIDQVFNGFGYIGSTVFALPGVKGLIPDGRNADGTLKNTAINVTSVQTRTFNGTHTFGIWINSSGYFSYYELTDITYDTKENLNIINSSGAVMQSALAGQFDITSGAISNFKPKNVTSF